jgi:hypothetical protein
VISQAELNHLAVAMGNRSFLVGVVIRCVVPAVFTKHVVFPVKRKDAMKMVTLD